MTDRGGSGGKDYWLAGWTRTAALVSMVLETTTTTGGELVFAFLSSLALVRGAGG